MSEQHVKQMGRGAVGPWAGTDLSDEGYDPLCPVFIHIWQVDFITEQNQPLPKLHRSQDDPIGRAPVLAVVVERLQQELWSGGAGEVKAHDLWKGRQTRSCGRAHTQAPTTLVPASWCNTSMSGKARRALKSVMVLPDPGGPQRTSGLCSASQV